MAKADDTTGDEQDITLRDVIAHIQSLKHAFQTDMRDMEQRLTVKIDANTRGIAQNTIAIQDLTLRIDALEEDLTATIKDTVKIRRHVGMVVADD